MAAARAAAAQRGRGLRAAAAARRARLRRRRAAEGEASQRVRGRRLRRRPRRAPAGARGRRPAARRLIGPARLLAAGAAAVVAAPGGRMPREQLGLHAGRGGGGGRHGRQPRVACQLRQRRPRARVMRERGRDQGGAGRADAGRQRPQAPRRHVAQRVRDAARVLIILRRPGPGVAGRAACSQRRAGRRAHSCRRHCQPAPTPAPAGQRGKGAEQRMTTGCAQAGLRRR